MPSDLRDRIVGLVDTAAPPIDVQSLAHQLAAIDERDAARRPSSIPPVRRRVWAFAGAFAGVLALIGGALLAGVWLHEPATPTPDGFADATSTTGAATSGWWWLALVVAFISLGAAAFAASRRRSERPKEEDAMQTMEKRTETTRQPEVERLTKQRRWLVVALAFVLVVGAVAISWLIAENGSAEAQPDAAIWPPESELTPRAEYMVDATERLWSAWNDEDFDTIMSLYAPHAVHRAYMDTEFSPVDSEFRSMMERISPSRGEYNVVRMMVVGSFVIHVIENNAGHREGYIFRFAPGVEPLIVSSYFGAESGGR